MMRKEYDLSGSWICKLDPQDMGIKEKWFNQIIDGKTVMLPGTTNEFGLGEKLDVSQLTVKEQLKRLRQKYRYKGRAWYQKTITLPEDTNHLNSLLYFERVMFSSQVWIDGMELGVQDSLSTPHTYKVQKQRGKKYTTITICIDNRDVQKIGEFSSAYTDETQTIWNGIIGRMSWQMMNPISIQHMDCFTSLSKKNIRIKMHTITDIAIKTDGTKVQIILKDDGKQLEMWSEPIKLKSGDMVSEFTVNVDAQLKGWDEFTPHTYELTLNVLDHGGKICDSLSKHIGFRDIKVHQTQFSINDRVVFLRGTLECCIFPKTGYPPTTSPYWIKIFKTMKSYGLNHLRFHSWCPPEIAFECADAYGIYLQVEGPIWMDTWCEMTVGCEESHYTYLMDEAKRIVKHYASHPSFCLFSNGNELNGDFSLLHDIVHCFSEDKRFLSTLTSNWDRAVDELDEYFVAQTVDGIGLRGQYFLKELVEGTKLNYSEAVTKRNMPIVVHEVGQYCVYPQMSEIRKYDGCLIPTNFLCIYEDLKSKGLLDEADMFTSISGRLAVDLYKAEIEAALRTTGLGGVQLLDLHDFPGQGTATVGIIDAFWDTKGLIQPHQFKQFFSDVVPLVELDKYIWDTSDVLTFHVLIANYGNSDLVDATLRVSLIDKTGKTHKTRTIKKDFIPQGELKKLESLNDIELDIFTDNIELTLVVEILGTEIKNEWTLWVMKDSNPLQEKTFKIYNAYNVEMKKSIMMGEKILYLPSMDDFNHGKSSKYIPVFWSPVHFSSDDSCGTWINKEHEIFRDFPTQEYSNALWGYMIDHAFTVEYGYLSHELIPITRQIPNFNDNNRRSSLFEVMVGKSKVLFCGLDFRGQLKPEQIGLWNSILSYMEHDNNSCACSVTIDSFEQFHLAGESDAKKDLGGINLAIGKKAVADSELEESFSAQKGNEPIAHTLWKAADYEVGHWWQVDLGEVVYVKGTKVKFEKKANYLYVIQVSNDGIHWETASNQTGQTSMEQVRTDILNIEARYIKIVYNGLPEDVCAAHYSFEVYG
ncbi:discoidin domain-containing protein [Vallitalea pronyensis]|uniref:Discoidin domain-containing protein n=1 Tax=Vallitalea pronyensis TaxID=1348613 RepID=A0A8J8MHB7_9FIRM|nr:discoidin domain-containing protein [Vallitalea pronyensis]QUI21604.1 discoidin domain-containing protein [Vallitalea pronyensis]